MEPIGRKEPADRKSALSFIPALEAAVAAGARC